MITFETLSIRLTVQGPTGILVPSLPVTFQYYSWTDQSWITLYETALNTKGSLILKRVLRTGVPVEEETFFSAIANEKMPPVRIIPTTGYDYLTRQPVLASTYSFTLIEELNTFEINFGTMWLVPDELLSDQSNRFPDFVPVASFFKSAMPTENTPLPINELYTNLVSEIETATSSTESAFKLSNISLKLKALVQRDGDSVNASLLDLDNSEAVNGNAISELVFDITPAQSGESASSTMPDVTGLTETAVRRVLKSLNLRLNPVYQNNSDVVNGDSFKQSPAVGGPIQPNQLVTVIFSKHE